MLVYFICLILICIFYRFLNKKKALFFSFILLTLVASLRSYNVGVDTQQYFDSYQFIGESDWRFIGFRYEFLFCVFVKILYQFSHNPQFLIFVSSIIINYSFYLFAKHNADNYFIFTILYVLMNIYFSNMNIMREALAISFTLFGFEFLKRRRYFIYIVFAFISFGFHNTGILSFVILLIFLFSDFKHMKLCVLLGGVTLFFTLNFVVVFFSEVMNLTYADYLSTEFGNGFNVGSVLDLLFYLLLIFLAYAVIYNGIPRNVKLTSYKKTNSFFYVMLLIFILLLTYTIKINIFNRLTIYFESFALVSLTNLLSKIRYKQINFSYISLKNTFAIVIPLSFISYWLIINYLRPEWAGCSNYNFYWNV